LLTKLGRCSGTSTLGNALYSKASYER